MRSASEERPPNHNEVLLNGAPNAGQTNQMAYSPVQDAVTEVRVNLFDMDAAYGHTMGGTVNVVTKSGTNDIARGGVDLQPDFSGRCQFIFQQLVG